MTCFIVSLVDIELERFIQWPTFVSLGQVPDS